MEFTSHCLLSPGMPDRWCVSMAHEWTQNLPLAKNELVCARCGRTKKIGEEAERCVPHIETKSSGWIQDNYTEVPNVIND